MDKPRLCPRCAGRLEAAPLTFTLAFTCNGCGLILARAQDAQRVVDELALLRAPHPRGNREVRTIEHAPVIERAA